MYRAQLHCDLERRDASNTRRQGRHAVRDTKNKPKIREVVNGLVDTSSLFMYVANHLSIICGQKKLLCGDLSFMCYSIHLYH